MCCLFLVSFLICVVVLLCCPLCGSVFVAMCSPMRVCFLCVDVLCCVYSFVVTFVLFRGVLFCVVVVALAVVCSPFCFCCFR